MQEQTQLEGVATQHQPCPNCQATIPVYRNYVSWCPNCNWNLKAFETKPRNFFESIYLKIGSKLSQKLYNEVAKAGSSRPNLNFVKIVTFAIASLIHLVTLGLVLGGVLLLVKGWPNPLLLALGLFVIWLAWYLRPRGSKVNLDKVVSAADFPTLYNLTEQVAQAAGTSAVKYILIDDKFNASIREFGWKRQKVLTIGLPLFSVLNNEEKVALLGHELSHCVNGDPLRGFFVGSALSTLIGWYNVLRPDALSRRNHRQGLLILLANTIINLLMAGLASGVKLLISGFVHLIWRESQRAEYLADGLAAQIGGTPAMLGMLDKLHLAGTYSLVAQRVSLNWQELNFFDELELQLRAIPATELERLRRAERLKNSRLDTTHPPTAYRLDFINNQPPQPARVVLTPELANQLNRELDRLRANVNETIIDNYKARLYR